MPRFVLLGTIVLAAASGLSGLVAAPEIRTLRFHADCLDLDTGVVMSCKQVDTWDVEIDYWAPTAVHAIVRQNLALGLEIAFVEDLAFADVTAAHVTDAVFSSDPAHVQFHSGTVLLVRTDQGAVFKLGLPTESAGEVTLTYERLDGGSGS